jgi:hypothetical protein
MDLLNDLTALAHVMDHRLHIVRPILDKDERGRWRVTEVLDRGIHFPTEDECPSRTTTDHQPFD